MNKKFVSNEDMNEIVHKIDKEFTSVRHEMKEEFSSIKHEIREMESRIVIRLGKIVAASIAVAIGLTSLIQRIT